MSLEQGLASSEPQEIATSGIDAEQLNEAAVKQLIAARQDAVAPLRQSTSKMSKVPSIGTNEESLSLSRPWGAMAPMTTKLPGKPYPIEALPDVIRDAVQEVQAYTQAPVALVANSALISLATACQAHFDVARDENLKAPVSLFFVTLADSGERKTTCDQFFSKTLLEYQAQVAKDRAPELNKYQADAAAWKAKEEGMRVSIKRATERPKDAKKEKSIDSLKDELRALHENQPQSPRVPSIVRTDDTSEKLAHVLAYEWPSAGVISSEGGLLFASRALNKDNVTQTLAIYNVLWDGGEWRIGRKTGDSFTVRGARLSIGVHVQPKVMENFLEGSENIARGIGFLARCLFSYPVSTQGSRPYKNAPKQMTSLDAFNSMVRQLLVIEPKLEDGRLVLAALPLSEAAKMVWIEFHDLIESQLATGNKYEYLRDVASKIADNACRIAAIFMATNGLAFTEIDEKSMKSACLIAEWYLHEALRYFGNESPSQKQTIQNAKKLEAKLILEAHRNSTSTTPKKTIMQCGPACVQLVEPLTEAVEFLQTRNRARFSVDGRMIELNPELICLANDLEISQ